MNERATVIMALVAGELTGALAVLIISRRGVSLLPGMDVTADLLSHLAIGAGAWVVLAAVAWILAPQLWRTRQHTRTKLSFLGMVFAVALSVSIITDAFQAAGADTVGRGRGSLVETVLVRSCGLLAGFWLATYLHLLVAGRSTPQVTPPPKFGKG